MEDKNEMTTLVASVGADAGQSSQNHNINIIQDSFGEFNGETEISSYENDTYYNKILQRLSDPGFMPVVSMEDIYGMVFNSKPWIVEGLLHTGAYILAGAPKLGKSFLVAQIAYHVSTGRPLWGHPVHRCPVLYMALEDDHQRLQSRMFRMFGVDSTPDLYFAIDAKKIRSGLESQMKTFIEDHPGTKLIIIDTLKKVREGDEDSYSYGRDYEDIGLLKKFADDNSVCLLIVHHTRKQGDENDQFNTIAGTTGLTGAADASFVLWKRRRTDTEATLQLTGRDVQDQKFYLTRDPEHLTWELDHVEVDEFKLPEDPILVAISRLVTSENTFWAGSPTELVSVLGHEISPISITKHLNVNASRLLKEHSIRYERKTTHDGRRIILTHSPSEA